MSLFTDKIELTMNDSRAHLIEKYVFDVKKGSIQIHVKPGYGAIINGSEKLGSNEVANFNKKTLGNTVTAFVYQKGTTPRPIVIPFFAGQHTISLDTHRTAKASFGLVGDAKIEIDDFKTLSRYFDNTVSYADVEKELDEKFKPALCAQVTSAAKTYINSQSTDVSIHADLRNIAKAALAGAALQNTLNDMGLLVMASGLTFRLNPIGNSEEVIAAINARFNEAAMEEFDEAKALRAREWKKEDKLIDNQHEIDIINAQNTNTRNQNNSNTYNYNGNVPKYAQDPNANNNQQIRYCPHCGAALARDDKFCSSCGRKVK